MYQQTIELSEQISLNRSLAQSQTSDKVIASQILLDKVNLLALRMSRINKVKFIDLFLTR